MKVKRILLTFLLLLCFDQLVWKFVWNDDRDLLQSVTSSFIFSLFWLLPVKFKSKAELDEDFLRDSGLTLMPDEKLSFGSTANKMIGSEVVGGKLFLSNLRLVFVPNKPNAANPQREFNRSRISSVQQHSEFPRAIVITMDDNHTHTFNVDKHSDWVHQLATA